MEPIKVKQVPCAHCGENVNVFVYENTEFTELCQICLGDEELIEDANSMLV